MAVDRKHIESFGEVSRTVGTVFRYLLLASTLIGIVSLGVLLAYVGVQAVQPFTADPAWYVFFAATFVLPTLGTGAWVWYNHRHAVPTVLGGLGIPFGGLFLGAAIVMLFLDVFAPTAWLGYWLALVLAGGSLALYRRQRRAGFLEEVVVGIVAFALFVAVVPRLVAAFPFYLLPWSIMWVTFTLPMAAGVTWFVGGQLEDQRTGRIAGGAAAALGLLAAFVGPYLWFFPMPSVVLATFVVIPTTAYAFVVVRDRPTQVPGLVVAGAFILGVLGIRYLAPVLGLAGPESWVDWQFLTSAHSNTAADAGLYPAIVGSVLLMLVVTLMSFPVGIGAAVYLEEYAPDNQLTRIIQVNISNLAGVPSVVYGLLGYGVFINTMNLPVGSVLVAGMTLSLLILPIVIISAQESIRSVPDSTRQASYGLGGTKWQTVRRIVLPQAMPGILTGTILALGRAIGETAPLIFVGLAAVAPVPGGFLGKGSAMPMQLYSWASLFASEEFYTTALAAGVVVSLVVLLTMNGIAIVLRNRYQREA
ncbi:phosphate ABC transporter permease PstA [Haloarchaeobius amylolyticus]|uniref:phosphate ABC transporter permease PstA n=1 Tax=Haloarchaeobius amylolyticus TaxID=1198296 RepID=UPI002270C284|nr:phosphate ABC transporter permease PstA [Haloarchaeobius amylolyticus]